MFGRQIIKPNVQAILDALKTGVQFTREDLDILIKIFRELADIAEAKLSLKQTDPDNKIKPKPPTPPISRDVGKF